MGTPFDLLPGSGSSHFPPAGIIGVSHMRLSEKCPVCNSGDWCGRPCARRPLVDQDMKSAAGQDARSVVSQSLDEVVSQNPIHDVANNMANTYRYRDPEKRKAYMREYMRRRRG